MSIRWYWPYFKAIIQNLFFSEKKNLGKQNAWRTDSARRGATRSLRLEGKPLGLVFQMCFCCTETMCEALLNTLWATNSNNVQKSKYWARNAFELMSDYSDSKSNISASFPRFYHPLHHLKKGRNRNLLKACIFDTSLWAPLFSFVGNVSQAFTLDDPCDTDADTRTGSVMGKVVEHCWVWLSDLQSVSMVFSALRFSVAASVSTWSSWRLG